MLSQFMNMELQVQCITLGTYREVGLLDINKYIEISIILGRCSKNGPVWTFTHFNCCWVFFPPLTTEESALDYNRRWVAQVCLGSCQESPIIVTVTPTYEHIPIPGNKESDSICSDSICLGMGPKGINSQFPYSGLCKTGSPDVCWFPNLPINSRNIILAMDLTFWCFLHSVYYLLL